MVFDGMRFIWSRRILFGLYITDFGLSSVGYFRPMLTILASDVFNVGPAGLGVLFSAPAIGAVLGFITMLLVGEVRRKGALFLIVTMCYALGLAFLGLSQWFWMGFAAGIILGYTDSISLVLRQTLTQLLSPDARTGAERQPSRGFSRKAATPSAQQKRALWRRQLAQEARWSWAAQWGPLSSCRWGSRGAAFGATAPTSRRTECRYGVPGGLTPGVVTRTEYTEVRAVKKSVR